MKETINISDTFGNSFILINRKLKKMSIDNITDTTKRHRKRLNFPTTKTQKTIKKK